MNGLPIKAKLSFALDDPVSLLSVDAGIEALVGFSARAFRTGEVDLRDRIHPDDADTAAKLFSHAAGEHAGIINLRLRHADGRIRCVRGSFAESHPKAGEGPVLELLLENANSLYKWNAQPERLTTIEPMMDFVGEVLYFKNRDHVFTSMNRAARQLFCGNAQDGSSAIGL